MDMTQFAWWHIYYWNTKDDGGRLKGAETRDPPHAQKQSNQIYMQVVRRWQHIVSKVQDTDLQSNKQLYTRLIGDLHRARLQKDQVSKRSTEHVEPEAAEEPDIDQRPICSCQQWKLVTCK